MTGLPEVPLSRRGVLRGAALLGAGLSLGGLELSLSTSALAVPAPTIASCATWGARNPSSTLSEIATDPTKIIIHHTATGNVTDYSLAAAYSLARAIQNYHMDSNGWADTGQHFTVSRGGHAMEGRHTSLSHLTTGNGMVVSAHTVGQNDKAIGIENEGTYISTTPPVALWNKLVDLCAYICDQYAIAPSQIYGHRDFNATACPGDAFYAQLPSLRTAVAAKLTWSTIVDNSAAGFRASTAWGTSTYSTQRYGTNYRYAVPTGTAGAHDLAIFAATLPSSATYRVEVWYPALPGYNAVTPHQIYSSSGTQTINVNQQTGGGAWRSLGTFAFSSGTRDIVGVSRRTSGTQYVIADAVRVTRV